MSIRRSTIRLASSLPKGSPERKALLRVLVGYPRLNRNTAKTMDADDAIEQVEKMKERLAYKLKDARNEANGEIKQQIRYIDDLDRAWKDWDWEWLENERFISKDEQDFIEEVRGMYSW